MMITRGWWSRIGIPIGRGEFSHGGAQQTASPSFGRGAATVAVGLRRARSEERGTRSGRWSGVEGEEEGGGGRGSGRSEVGRGRGSGFPWDGRAYYKSGSLVCLMYVCRFALAGNSTDETHRTVPWG
jgi:hypothetical protein